MCFWSICLFGLFCCWLLGIVDASNMCLERYHFLQIAKCPWQP
jgi:hypothetical protein